MLDIGMSAKLEIVVGIRMGYRHCEFKRLSSIVFPMFPDGIKSKSLTSISLIFQL